MTKREKVYRAEIVPHISAICRLAEKAGIPFVMSFQLTARKPCQEPDLLSSSWHLPRPTTETFEQALDVLCPEWREVSPDDPERSWIR